MERLIIEGQQAEDIKSTLIDILQRARSSSYTNLSLATGSGVFPPFNPYNLSINELGDSYQTFSRAAQLASTASMSVQPNLSQKNILQAFGSVYETYGTGLSERDRISLSTVFGRDRDLPFDLGMKEVPDAVAMSVAERFALIGDPFSFIDPNSRVMSTIVSDVTSGLGVQLNRGIVRDGFEKADLAFSAQPKQMAELGLGFFQAQDRSSTFRMLTPGESGTSKIITPYEIVQAAFDDVMGKKADTLRRVGFSIFQDGDQSTVNLVWNISEQLGDVEQKAVMKKIFDIMSDADEVAKVMGKSVDELDQTLLTDIQAVKSAIGRPGAALNESEMLSQALEVAKKRGIVIGNLGPEESERLIRAFGRKGVEFTNDVTIKSMMTSIFRHGGDRSVLVTTPVIDMDAARIAGQVDKVDAANKIVREVIDKNTGQTRIRSKQIDSYNKISNQFFDKNFLRQVTSKVRKSKLGETDAVVAGLYNNYKKNIAIGAAIAGLGAFAYYKTKKNREQKLYEDVIKTQEYETLRDEDPLKDIQGVYNYRPITSDPLATAGVVGSLDRSKIGHTRMGNDRYNHLFNVG